MKNQAKKQQVGKKLFYCGIISSVVTGICLISLMLMRVELGTSELIGSMLFYFFSMGVLSMGIQLINPPKDPSHQKG